MDSEQINGVFPLDDEEGFAEEFLQRHNELRKIHSSPALTLNNELCDMAREWASKLMRKGHVSFAEKSGIGENITVFPANKSAKEIVDYWYGENSKYEYETPGWQAGTNYFTQIVWRSTTEVLAVPDSLEYKEAPKRVNNSSRQRKN